MGIDNRFMKRLFHKHAQPKTNQSSLGDLNELYKFSESWLYVHMLRLKSGAFLTWKSWYMKILGNFNI